MFGFIYMAPKQEIKRKRAEELTSAHYHYEKGMHRYASFKVDSSSMGDDLVQDTFLKTWRYLVKEGKIELMKPFLYHVLNQLIVDEYRKKYRKCKVSSLDALLEKGFDPSFDHSKSMIDTIDGKTALSLIQHLPEKYERIMRMRYVQELSLEEISLITGQSRNTVAVQAHRGVAKLRELYDRTQGYH